VNLGPKTNITFDFSGADIRNESPVAVKKSLTPHSNTKHLARSTTTPGRHQKSALKSATKELTERQEAMLLEEVKSLKQISNEFMERALISDQASQNQRQ